MIGLIKVVSYLIKWDNDKEIDRYKPFRALRVRVKIRFWASACSAGDPSLIPGLGRSPGEGNGNPLQYSCLENPMDWGAWWVTVHGVAKSRTRLIDFTSLHIAIGIHYNGVVAWNDDMIFHFEKSHCNWCIKIRI